MYFLLQVGMRGSGDGRNNGAFYGDDDLFTEEVICKFEWSVYSEDFFMILNKHLVYNFG